LAVFQISIFKSISI